MKSVKEDQIIYPFGVCVICFCVLYKLFFSYQQGIMGQWQHACLHFFFAINNTQFLAFLAFLGLLFVRAFFDSLSIRYSAVYIWKKKSQKSCFKKKTTYLRSKIFVTLFDSDKVFREQTQVGDKWWWCWSQALPVIPATKNELLRTKVHRKKKIIYILKYIYFYISKLLLLGGQFC